MWRLKQFVDKAQDFIAPEATQQSRPDYGFRVLHVEPESPCAALGLEPLFDYIVSVDGPLECEFQGPEPAAPMEKFFGMLGSARSLGVWSAKGGQERSVRVTPEPTTESFGLGLVVRWTATECADHVWHILEVTPGTPAAAAGLLSHSDFIVGAQDGVLEGGGEHLLGRAIANAAHQGAGLLLFVYNHDYGTLRPVEIHPRVDPYGNATMGCSIGYGLLHRLPAQVGGLAPGSTLYEDFEPVNSAPEVGAPAAAPALGTVTPTPVAAPPPRKKHAKKEGDKVELGDYFSEQQKISRQQDGKARKVKGDVAPPPKREAPSEAS